MKYVAMTDPGRMPVAHRLPDDRAAKAVATGRWHYVNKAAYRRIEKQRKRLLAQLEAEAKRPNAPRTMQPRMDTMAMAVRRGLSKP